MPINTITINAGEVAYLPKTATILSVDATEGISLSSSCISTDVLPRKCYRISWAITENSGGETQAWEDSDTNNKVTRISIAGVVYTVDLDFDDEVAIMNQIVTLSGGAISSISTSQTSPISDVDTVSVTFRAPASIGANLWLGFSISNTLDSDIRIYAKEISCPVE